MKRLFVSIFSVALLGSCMKLPGGPSARVAARINGQPVFLQEFMMHFNQIKSGLDEISKKNPKVIEQIKLRSLNETIILALLRQEARKQQISVAREAVEGRLANWKDGYPPGGFDEMLRRKNTSEKYLKRRIEDLLLLEKLTSTLFASETLVSREEIKKHYNKNRRKYTRPEKVHVLQILVPTKEEAEKIRQEIVSGKLTFESAARRYSLSPDASKGGDIGLFGRNDKIPAFNKAFSLKVGDISKPIQSPYGFHLLKNMERQVKKRLSFRAATQLVAEDLKKEKEMKIYKEWMSKLLKEGKIYRNDALFVNIS